VLTLAYTMRLHGNNLPLLLMHFNDDSLSPASREVAVRAGWQLYPVERIAPFKPTGMMQYQHQCASLSYAMERQPGLLIFARHLHLDTPS
jgi:hypothetical protein